MRVLQRYFWSQALWPLLLTLLALTSLALLTQSLQTLDLIVENRQSALTFFYITILALPQLIGIILPLAVFMAALFALNRLNMDSELIVAKAAGFSPWQISSPLARLGVYALIAHLIINLLLQPLSFRQMRAEILKVRTDIASQMIQAGQFVTPSPKLTLYAREVELDGQLQDVLIVDGRDSENVTTHIAKSGNLIRNEEVIALVLREGSIQQTLDDGSLDVIAFDDYTVDLSDIAAADTVLRLKSSDRFLHELLTPSQNTYLTAKLKREYAAEGHARLAAPLYNVALILLALCFMVRGEHKRLGYGRHIAVCAVIGFTARLSGFALTSLAEGDPALNPVQYALPGAMIVLCLLYLWKRKRIKTFRARRAKRNYDRQIETQNAVNA